MINSVGQTLGSALEATRLREGNKARATASTSSASPGETSASSASPVSRMAAEGAPVDLDRIAAIKSAIASGNYPVDADRIADRMIALDLPTAG
jgi:negative regulator of flagellin synthesis FlgM